MGLYKRSFWVTVGYLGFGAQRMPSFQLFLSVVYVVRNQCLHLEDIVRNSTAQLSSLVTDYELIIVDNASDDDSITRLKNLTARNGYPNLQVFALTKEVDHDTATWVGLENALGDFVAVLDPLADDLQFLPNMLERAVGGADVVFANNRQKPRESLGYRIAHAAFNTIYKTFSGVNLAREAPKYRLLSKRVVNFILQHPQPAVSYRYLPATGGFTRANMEYSSVPRVRGTKRLGDSIDRGLRLLVSTTHTPLRLVASLSLFGAAANVLYSLYVVGIAFLKSDVAPGWVSMSLQQSGMFFLISLVLLVLGEYILHMGSVGNDGPRYHVGQEFTSARMTRREKLNIEDVSSQKQPGSDPKQAVA